MNEKNTSVKQKESRNYESLGAIIFTVVLLGLMWAASKWLL